MGEGFDHRFGLQDAGGEALQEQQPDTGVLLDGAAHGGGRCGDHLHPGEGNGVIEAIRALTCQQGEHPKQAVLPQQGHRDLLPRFVDPGQSHRSPAQQIHPLGRVPREKDRFAALDGFDAAAGQPADHLQQGGVALARTPHPGHHPRSPR